MIVSCNHAATSSTDVYGSGYEDSDSAVPSVISELFAASNSSRSAGSGSTRAESMSGGGAPLVQPYSSTGT